MPSYMSEASGSLTIAEGCVLFRSGGTTYLPVFPFGTRVEHAQQRSSVRLPDGSVLLLHTPLKLSGGARDLPADGRWPEKSVPKDCRFRLFMVGTNAP